MEYFDVLNNKREKLNYIKERGKKLNKNEYNTGVELYITSNNKLLVTQRSLEKSHPLEWEVPGGCVRASESSLYSLKREILEEVSIKLNMNKVIYIGTYLYKKNYVDIYTTEISKLDITKLIKQDEEINDIKLVNESEYNKLNKVKSVESRFNKFKDLMNLNWK